MIRAPLRLTLIVFAATALALGGCLVSDRPPESPKLGTVISDLTLTLDLRDGSGAEEYYEVRRDGTFGFGGGMDARFQRVTWTTQLTSDEMLALRTLMIDNNWFNDGLHSTKQPKEARYEIDARCEAGSVHKRIEGQNDRVEPVRLALREIANRRLETDLERQPTPSIQNQPAATQQ